MTVLFSRGDIETFIPHRGLFLLIDTITALQPNDSVQATKSVRRDDPMLSGHFPGNPIFPGVLIVEGIAQAAGVLGWHSAKPGAAPGGKVLLTEITKSRFRHVVVPDGELLYDVRVVKRKGHFFWFKGEATYQGHAAASVEFSALMQ